MSAPAEQSPDQSVIRSGRRTIGVLGALLSLGYLLRAASQLNYGNLARPGGALFPTIIGLFALLISVATIVQSIKGSDFAQEDGSQAPVSRSHTLTIGSRRLRFRAETKAALLILLLLAYAVALPLAGFVPSSVVLVVLFGLLVRTDVSLIRYVIYALALVGALYYLFAEILNIRLP